MKTNPNACIIGKYKYKIVQKHNNSKIKSEMCKWSVTKKIKLQNSLILHILYNK